MFFGNHPQRDRKGAVSLEMKLEGSWDFAQEYSEPETVFCGCDIYFKSVQTLHANFLLNLWWLLRK